MALKVNLLANYLGAAIAVASPILALPYYLSTLGASQWGLVSFAVMLQSLLGLLDAGLSQGLTREFAVRLSSVATGRSAAELLLGFERIYWGFALGAAVLTILFSAPVATFWLNLGDLPSEFGRITVVGAAAIFAVQFPGSVYRSAISAAQAQVTLNLLISSGVLLRQIGGVVVVSVWPTVTAYLIWTFCIALIETSARYVCAWRIVTLKGHTVHWQPNEVVPTLRFVLKMSGTVLLGVLTMQMDKLVVSKLLPVDVFGYYTIASTAALGCLQLIYPITQAVLPRMVGFLDDPEILRRFQFKVAGLLLLLLLIATTAFVAEGRHLVQMWLRNSNAALAVIPLLNVLLVGTALNVLYNIGYLHWLVHGQTRQMLRVNAIGLIMTMTVTPVCVGKFGAIGACFGWIGINFVGLILSLEWIGSRSKSRHAFII